MRVTIEIYRLFAGKYTALGWEIQYFQLESTLYPINSIYEGLYIVKRNK